MKRLNVCPARSREPWHIHNCGARSHKNFMENKGAPIGPLPANTDIMFSLRSDLMITNDKNTYEFLHVNFVLSQEHILMKRKVPHVPIELVFLNPAEFAGITRCISFNHPSM
ncbi:hypothetical protein ILYODFUR_024017 [Ilyodon furcidens]|uniref:Uncharacterized protein n=1 Tax=Ilyodon furcidens TaxID=33524 RepID=A0ABV0SPQ0_9TELE